MTEPMKLIPLSEITPEARKIAVAWVEDYQRMGFDIEQKHKLASDIMNYAAQQVAAERERIKSLLSAKFLDRDWSVVEKHRSISYLDLKELIDSL